MMCIQLLKIYDLSFGEEVANEGHLVYRED